MEKGKIIFINGVSSSGKTMLAKALQERLEEPYFLFNWDSFVAEIIPKKFQTADSDGKVFYLKALSAMFQTIKLYSDLGLNAIVDHVFEKSFFESELKSLDECIEILHEYPVLFIHVTCPIQELRRREKARGDRQIGQAESQLSTLVPQDTEIYDITIDTHEYSSRECTDKIIEMLGYPKKHKAFKTLWLQSSMVQKAARQGCRALRTR